jgi:hypothetical protein
MGVPLALILLLHKRGRFVKYQPNDALRPRKIGEGIRMNIPSVMRLIGAVFRVLDLMPISYTKYLFPYCTLQSRSIRGQDRATVG